MVRQACLPLLAASHSLQWPLSGRALGRCQPSLSSAVRLWRLVVCCSGVPNAVVVVVAFIGFHAEDVARHAHEKDDGPNGAETAETARASDRLPTAYSLK